MPSVPISGPSDTIAPEEGPVLFEARIRPNRSFSRRAFRYLMIAIAVVSFACGLGFFLAGAWPVVGFLGLDVMIVYLAFRASYRSTRAYETLRMTARRLTVTKVDPWGRQRRWSFQPYWLRVSLEEPVTYNSRLVLSSHGNSVTIGSFLAPEERGNLADTLRNLIIDLREQPNPA